MNKISVHLIKFQAKYLNMNNLQLIQLDTLNFCQHAPYFIVKKRRLDNNVNKFWIIDTYIVGYLHIYRITKTLSNQYKNQEIHFFHTNNF